MEIRNGVFKTFGGGLAPCCRCAGAESCQATCCAITRSKLERGLFQNLRNRMLTETIFPRIYARTYYAHPRARVMSFSNVRHHLERRLFQRNKSAVAIADGWALRLMRPVGVPIRAHCFPPVSADH